MKDTNNNHKVYKEGSRKICMIKVKCLHCGKEKLIREGRSYFYHCHKKFAVDNTTIVDVKPIPLSKIEGNVGGVNNSSLGVQNEVSSSPPSEKKLVLDVVQEETKKEDVSIKAEPSLPSHKYQCGKCNGTFDVAEKEFSITGWSYSCPHCKTILERPTNA